MSKYELINVGPLPVKVYRNKFTDGTCQVLLNCGVKDCPRKCGISYRTEPELWRVAIEQHAEKLSSLCGKLAKMAKEIEEHNGQRKAI